MNGQGACSSLLELRPHRDDGVRARRRDAVGATVDVKPVDGDGPGNRWRRLCISNSTRQRSHAGAAAGRCGSRDRALSRSAPLARWPDNRSLRSPSSVPHRRGAEIGVAVFRDSTFRRTSSRVALTSKSPGWSTTDFTAGASAATSEGKWPGSATPSWTDEIVALIAPQASCRRTSRSGNFSASTTNSKLARLSALTQLQATRQNERGRRAKSRKSTRAQCASRHSSRFRQKDLSAD
jgi:hypothetical protein